MSKSSPRRPRSARSSTANKAAEEIILKPEQVELLDAALMTLGRLSTLPALALRPLNHDAESVINYLGVDCCAEALQEGVNQVDGQLATIHDTLQSAGFYDGRSGGR